MLTSSTPKVDKSCAQGQGRASTKRKQKHGVCARAGINRLEIAQWYPWPAPGRSVGETEAPEPFGMLQLFRSGGCGLGGLRVFAPLRHLPGLIDSAQIPCMIGS